MLFPAPALAATGARDGPVPAHCPRVPLDEAPSWSWSGAWAHDGSRLVLADVADGNLKIYARDGALLNVIERPGTGPLDFNRPNSIVAVEGGYWLKDGASHFVFLDRTLTPREGVDPGAYSPGVNGIPRAFFDWTATSDRLYALGDLLLSEEQRTWESGWLEMDLRNPRRARMFRPAPSETALHRLYRLGYPYAAADGENVFFLLLESGGPSLLQVAPLVRRLRAFPEGFGALPRPPSSNGGRRTGRLYGFLEDAQYPTGLYAWRGLLYVLTRSPGAGGETHWRLHVVDPERDEVVGALTLPTRAPHLGIVPGPRFWALIEKGPVESRRGGRQPILGVRFPTVRTGEDQKPWPAPLCRPAPRASDE